jgi:hypothetical protein
MHIRCIVQDDIEDWRRESATMRDVYSNAAFCIAATIAQDGNDGLFTRRNFQSLTAIQVKLWWPEDVLSDLYLSQQDTYWLRCYRIIPWWAIDSAPLNQRAWV